MIDNALMWLRDHHVDGLRLDAVHALVDHSPPHILAELAERTAQLAGELGRPLTLDRRIGPQRPGDDHTASPPAASAWTRSGATTSITRSTWR